MSNVALPIGAETQEVFKTLTNTREDYNTYCMLKQNWTNTSPPKRMSPTRFSISGKQLNKQAKVSNSLPPDYANSLPNCKFHDVNKKITSLIVQHCLSTEMPTAVCSLRKRVKTQQSSVKSLQLRVKWDTSSRGGREVDTTQTSSDRRGHQRTLQETPKLSHMW